MKKALTIKPTRLYFEKRKRLRFRLDNNFATIGLYEQQILDYILYLTLDAFAQKRHSDFDANNYYAVLLYATDFLRLKRNRRPSGDEYAKFHQAVAKLKITYLCRDQSPEMVSDGRGIIDETQQCIFDLFCPIKNAAQRVIGYQIKISRILARELQWVSDNPPYMVAVANMLTTKYSFDLYTYLILKLFFLNGSCHGQSTELQKALYFAEWDRTTRQQVTRAANKISESYKNVLGQEIIINMKCSGNVVLFCSPQIAAKRNKQLQQEKNKAKLITQKVKQVAAIKKYDPNYPKTGSVFVENDDADDSEEWC